VFVVEEAAEPCAHVRHEGIAIVPQTTKPPQRLRCEGLIVTRERALSRDYGKISRSL
jgi:hypothetical protein